MIVQLIYDTVVNLMINQFNHSGKSATIRESKRIMAWVYVRSITRSTFVSQNWRMKN